MKWCFSEKMLRNRSSTRVPLLHPASLKALVSLRHTWRGGGYLCRALAAPAPSQVTELQPDYDVWRFWPLPSCSSPKSRSMYLCLKIFCLQTSNLKRAFGVLHRRSGSDGAFRGFFLTKINKNDLFQHKTVFLTFQSLLNLKLLIVKVKKIQGMNKTQQKNTFRS